PVERLRLQPGDLLLLYTDGATDSESRDHVFYGIARLRALLASSRQATAKDLVELVRADIRRFATGADQADDITLLALSWHGNSSNGRESLLCDCAAPRRADRWARPDRVLLAQQL